MKAEWEGEEKQVRKAEEEEEGLDLSESDQLSKKPDCHWFPSSQQSRLSFHLMAGAPLTLAIG